MIMMIMLMNIVPTFAQSADGMSASTSLMIVLGFALVVVVIVLMVAVMMLRVLRTMVKDQAMANAVEAGEEYQEEPSLWEKIDKKYLTQAVELKDEKSIELDHDYDGIKELDNHLPPWWKYMFYMSIVFAVVYIALYHFTGTLPLQTEEYNNELAVAEAQKAALISEGGGANIDEESVLYSEDAAVLSAGAKVYEMNCVSCHKANAEGGIGPNLTDDYWIHEGGSINHIFKAVKYGFPDKGMISWEPLLTPQQMSDVSSYVKSLKGSNPANAKDPQGELYVEEDMKEVETVVADTTVVAEAVGE